MGGTAGGRLVQAFAQLVVPVTVKTQNVDLFVVLGTLSSHAARAARR